MKYCLILAESMNSFPLTKDELKYNKDLRSWNYEDYSNECKFKFYLFLVNLTNILQFLNKDNLHELKDQTDRLISFKSNFLLRVRALNVGEIIEEFDNRYEIAILKNDFNAYEIYFEKADCQLMELLLTVACNQDQVNINMYELNNYQNTMSFFMEESEVLKQAGLGIENLLKLLCN